MPEIVESDVIAGVYTVSPTLHGDERGLFIETYRREWFPGGREMIQGNRGDRRQGSVVGLHYHLHQDDIWFVPPPSKAKFVLFDVRNTSPTFGKTQVIVAGGGQDLLVRIPAGVAHGYRPLTNPCALLYFVTETFDPAAPDELRIPWDHPAVKNLWDVPNG